MAVDGIVLEKFRQEGDLVLKRRLASSNPPSTVDTPRASSVSSVPSSVKSTLRRNRERPTKYVSQMAKAREEKKRAAAQRESSHSDKSTTSLNSFDMETSSSSNPSSASGTSLQSGDKLSALPKFGEWVKHSANSGPCYTLLFQNAAQEKKNGGPVPVHKPVTPAPNEDLYGYHRSGSVRKPRKRQFYGLLFCFTCTESS